MFTALNDRSRTVFEYIVSTYLSSGIPVGSRTIAVNAGLSLSPASIRNVMADLEDAGLLFAPHTSAGRIPTHHGLRLYIDGIMQLGHLSPEEQRELKSLTHRSGRSLSDVLDDASRRLSGLSSCASLVVAPTSQSAIKQIQFVELSHMQTLVILVFENGLVENRVIEHPAPMPLHALQEATNYLNHHLKGQTIAATTEDILANIKDQKSQLDQITKDLIAKGLAEPVSAQAGERIIIKGQSRLLEDMKAIADIERARVLLEYLEENRNMLKLLESVDQAQGVQIFIGAENDIFDQTGWSMIISPYRDSSQKLVGAIGVIGPTRLNYDRIIPMVDYTSKIVSKIVDEF